MKTNSVHFNFADPGESPAVKQKLLFKKFQGLPLGAISEHTFSLLKINWSVHRLRNAG